MAKLVITSYPTKVIIFTNDLKSKFINRKQIAIYLDHLVRVELISNDNVEFVEIILSSGNPIQISFQDVDSIDGDSDISTDQILFNKLEAFK